MNIKKDAMTAPVRCVLVFPPSYPKETFVTHFHCCYCHFKSPSVKESTRQSKLLSETNRISRKIVTVVEYLLKSEAIHGRV